MALPAPTRQCPQATFITTQVVGPCQGTDQTGMSQTQAWRCLDVLTQRKLQLVALGLLLSYLKIKKT